MAQKKKQLVAEGKLDKHGRPNETTPKEYLRSLPDVTPATKVSHPYLINMHWWSYYLHSMLVLIVRQHVRLAHQQHHLQAQTCSSCCASAAI